MKAGTVTTNSQRDTRNSATRGRSVPRAVRAPGAQSVSLWQATERIPLRPALRRATSVDVCVVGGGIAGLSTAYHLALAGRSVVVLEHGSIGGGQTGRTSAHLSNAMDVQYQVIRRLHGVRGAELAAESHTRAIARIGEISEREHITCDLESVDGYLFLAPGASESVLERELEATRDAGLTGVEWLARTPWPGYEMGPCLRFPPRLNSIHCDTSAALLPPSSGMAAGSIAALVSRASRAARWP